ncbi:MAG: hypothetical protein Q8R95_13400 [Azonexus sp.]|nr:hypothetical protein [Azonexus sp.]
MKDRKHSRWLIVGTLLVNAVGWSVQANADEAVQPIVNNSPALFEAAAVDSEKLAISRGGADLHLNEINSDGLVSNNQASNLTTGSNWITEGSFAGAAGFSTVVQNSGNNVLIQNPTIINLQVQ